MNSALSDIFQPFSVEKELHGFSLTEIGRLLSNLDSAEEVPCPEHDFLFEPTPFGPNGVQSCVEEVHVTDNTWYADQTFAHALNPLLTDGETMRFHQGQADQWKERFQDLIDFHEEHGHFLVPNTYPENQHLAQWV